MAQPALAPSMAPAACWASNHAAAWPAIWMASGVDPSGHTSAGASSAHVPDGPSGSVAPPKPGTACTVAIRSAAPPLKGEVMPP